MSDQQYDKDKTEKLKELYDQAFKIDVKLEINGMMPIKAHKSDAGFDLYATQDIEIKPGQVIKHPLGIRLKLPKATYAEITTKSGLGSKGMLVYAGIIDAGYRGIVHVVASNINTDACNLYGGANIEIKKHDKIAQLILHPYTDQYYINVVNDLDTKSDRGEGGFGSTGR